MNIERMAGVIEWSLAACLLGSHNDAAAQNLAGSWAPHGVPVETAATSDAMAALPVADGAGGVFVVWTSRAAGAATDEVRCTHLIPDGTLDPRWPFGGRLVGSYPGRLDAVSDGAGGVYAAFGTPSRVSVVRLLSAGEIAPGWTSAGVPIGGSSFGSLLTTGDRSVWGTWGDVQENCPIGHYYCENIVVVGARRVSPEGVDLTGPFPGGMFVAHGGDLITWMQGASYAGGIRIYYETGVIGSGYQRYVVANPVNGVSAWTLLASNPARDYSLHLGVDAVGASFTTEGGYAMSILRRTGPAPAWPGPWIYAPGPYSGAYPLEIIANPDGSLLSHSMVFESDPSPHIVDSFVQRVLPSGATDPSWPVQGVSTRGPALLYQNSRTLVPDGRGGCLVVWEDSRSGEPDIYALPIEGNGRLTPGWLLSGTALCRLPDSPQLSPRATHDGLGNLFVTWIDGRNGGRDVYAQSIAADRPVPVVVGRAWGSWTGTAVEVEWTLFGENPGQLTVERSIDGVGWAPVGAAVPAQAADAWRYTDVAPVRPGRNHYRLTRPAGVLSGTEVDVDVPGDERLRIIRVSPNPAGRYVDLSLMDPGGGPLSLSLIDVMGRTRLGRTEGVEPGLQSIRLTGLAGLPAGLYLLRVQQADVVRTARLLITR